MGIDSKKSGYMYMCNWFKLLYTWHRLNIVNQLYSNKNFLKIDVYHWCFWTVMVEKTLERPLDCKINPVNPKGNQPWI